MKWQRFLALAALAAVCVCAQNTTRSGRVAVSNQFGLGTHPDQLSVPTGNVILHGILVDAGCRDPNPRNLRQPPETLQAAQPAEPPTAAQNNPPLTGAVSAKGIAVDSATINAERGDVMDAHTPGMVERQSDPTCAVTANTTSFAVYTDSGRLVNLDQGGNTYAVVAVQATDAGRAMLNGQGPGIKPRVTVRGQLMGDRLLVNQIQSAQ